MSKIPYINRLINKDHHFVAFDYLLCKRGHEQEMQILLESVLSKMKVYSGLIALDDQSVLYENFKKMDLGPLNSFKKEVRAHVIIKTTLPVDQTNSTLKSKPSFISTMDLT